jgi:hypothetical protein
MPIAVTTPVSASIVIFDAVDDHEPPLTAFVSVVVPPAHTVAVPPIAAGAAFTITHAVCIHPAFSAYVIAVEPAETPVTTPVVVPTVAIAVLILLHAPPVGEPANDVVPPMHRAVPPVIIACVLTVTTLVATHPTPMLYVIVAVPAVIPFTMPVEAPTETLLDAVLHEPPVVASASVIALPIHTDEEPVMAVGPGLTNTIVVW